MRVRHFWCIETGQICNVAISTIRALNSSMLMMKATADMVYSVHHELSPFSMPLKILYIASKSTTCPDPSNPSLLQTSISALNWSDLVLIHHDALCTCQLTIGIYGWLLRGGSLLSLFFNSIVIQFFFVCVDGDWNNHGGHRKVAGRYVHLPVDDPPDIDSLCVHLFVFYHPIMAV